MTTINSLVTTVNQSVKKASNIKVRLINKFKSNPIPTAGLLDSLKTGLHDFATIRKTLEEACTQILSRLDEISASDKREKNGQIERESTV